MLIQPDVFTLRNYLVSDVLFIEASEGQRNRSLQALYRKANLKSLKSFVYSCTTENMFHHRCDDTSLINVLLSKLVGGSEVTLLLSLHKSISNADADERFFFNFTSSKIKVTSIVQIKLKRKPCANELQATP